MKDRLLGRIIADRFRLESRLGVGGMGAVYRARHLLIDRVVAIKILQPERRGEEHFRAWFLREARASNRVNHANIVDINDFGETEDGLAYLVMELLVGEGLSVPIARGPMDLGVSLDILEQTTAALARAHDLGVVHRDIKPDNIFLINKGGRKNFVKVIDFGLARLSRDGRLAAKGAVFGTPEYMSPEQARGDDATPSSDLYALGIIFFEMLTGQLPFVATDRDGYIENHKRTEPMVANHIKTDIDPRASLMIATLLEKDPAKRFRDAHHFLEELKTLQRRIAPVSPWEISDSQYHTGKAPLQGIMTAALNDVARWALKATVFGRMAATTYPNDGGPLQISESIESIWRLAASSTRLDGELQTAVQNNENLLRRGKDFTAQVGRRIEDLSREKSRLKREISAAASDIITLKNDYARANIELQKTREIISSIDTCNDDMTDKLRTAYEKAGSAAARRQVRIEAVEKVNAKIKKWKDDSSKIDDQLEEYKHQLERHSFSTEDALETARINLDSKIKKRDSYSQKLSEAADHLSLHFKHHPGCVSLFKELSDLDRNSILIESSQ